MSRGRVAVFAGAGNPALAESVCAALGVGLSPSVTRRFANDCLEVQLLESCRGRDVFLIQPLVPPVQESLVELLLMIDAARGASAGRITVVMPHFAYARSDKKDAARVSIGGRLVADMIETAGADRVLVMTLHSPQVHAFFKIPVDHLHALRELSSYFGPRGRETVVVSPDLGNAKEAARFAALLGRDVTVAAATKTRSRDGDVVIDRLIGDVAGKDVIVLDDEIARGSTVIELLRHVRELGPRSVRVACTHGIFADGALERVYDAGADELIGTDTVPPPASGVTVLSIAPALARAIERIHAGESVSELFR